MKGISKKWLIGIGLVILIALFWGMCGQTALTVETGAVKRGEILVTIDGEGKTRVRRKFTVTAPVSGKMSRIRLNEGDHLPQDFIMFRK